jgi:hypothetical protein
MSGYLMVSIVSHHRVFEGEMIMKMAAPVVMMSAATLSSPRRGILRFAQCDKWEASMLTIRSLLDRFG